jgi:hypothetical protein
MNLKEGDKVKVRLHGYNPFKSWDVDATVSREIDGKVLRKL